MLASKPKVLVVDDEPLNLMILEDFLHEAEYDIVQAENGNNAWEILEASHEDFDAILLDRVMPGMDGIEVLQRIKAREEMKKLPVIMQTAKSSEQDVLDGLEAGAYYYLTKPFEKRQLLAIVQSAVQDYIEYRQLKQKTEQINSNLALLDQGQFSFQTLDEARMLAPILASVSPEPAVVVLGLSELLANAVEHGNLGISYEDKSLLNEEGDWGEEVLRRLALPENLNKRVKVTFIRSNTEICFEIEDEGEGFDWQKYLALDTDRAFDSHGRGIAMANMMSFDRLEYLGAGNRVKATVSLSD